jgi:uncharacterized protein (UPF0332 family)
MKPETAELLEQPEENIKAADILIQAHFFEIAISRGYYAIFYIARALLLEEGKTSSSHREVQSAFGRLFAKTSKLDPKFHQYLIKNFRKRQVADYQRHAEVSEADAVETVDHAEEFLAAAKSYLASIEPSTP